MTKLSEAAFDLQRQTWENAAEFVDKLSHVDDANRHIAAADVGETPSEVVYEENKLELLHYEPRTEEQRDVPILFVYALFNKPFILDLQPDRSVIRTFLDEGFDVYMIDWNEPSLLDHALGFDDYVDRYVDNCVNVVRERSGQDAINLFGYCMGGAISVIYASLYPDQVRNLALMAVSASLRDTDSVLDQWVGNDFFDVQKLVDTYGNAPAEFVDAGFSLREPVRDNLSKYLRFFDGIDEEDFVENFARMERWVDESIDIPGRVFVEFVETVYEEQKIYNNEMYIDGEHADLGKLDMPIVQVIGNYDHVVPPEAQRKFNEVLPGRTTVFESDTGHMGLAVSGRAHAELWPSVCSWFEERSRIGADERGESGAHDSDGDLESIDGIGPIYAERLREAGVETVADLADADADALAETAGIPANRLDGWIQQTRE
ncbi:alpha/beta fold hydrolase [Natronomonas salsuginis]|uniref:Alpha/beta fold hydrolase n=1 Tax=Natronomonas salsuginis TaxID=2217661 RepID=A0A4U5J9W9_9EURY|nr:alpha/beta fold hydrolase [Natronomonas salsuginis]TKR24538.1 alpha/beta fold hydrolase [Natronomonas salsuginis]